MRHFIRLGQWGLILGVFLTASTVVHGNDLSPSPASTTSATRLLRFPADRSLGCLVDLDQYGTYLDYPPLHWSWLGAPPTTGCTAMQGDVMIPSGQRVGLIIKAAPDDDLAPLAALPPGSVEFLSFDPTAPPPNDQCLPVICALPGLKTLILRETHISNDSLSSLSQVASLERLYVAHKDLDTTGIRNIASISSLKGLRIWSAHPFTAEQAGILSRLQALEEFCLPRNPDTGTLASLARLPLLRRLYIGGGECCDIGLEQLANFPALTHLDFYDLSPKGLAALPPLPNLRKLKIQYKGDAYGPEHLTSLAGFPKLERLQLRARFTDDGLVCLKSLKQLKEIGLHANFQDFLRIGDETLAHLSNLENLETIELYTGEYSEEGLRHLTRLPRLKKLAAPNSGSVISDSAFEHLGKVRTLEVLYLRGGPTVSDKALQHLEGLTSLRSLRFSLPTQVTEQGIARLKARLPQLKVVSNGQD